MRHGPAKESSCDHCEGWRKRAEATVGDTYRMGCKVCQGWGWNIGCPGCGRIWGKFWAAEKSK